MSRRSITKASAWRRAQNKDPQVRAARAQGYRSRAALKLLEIDDAEKLFFSGARVADLGSAPGGWSQVAAARCGKNGRIAAADILPMAPVAGVFFVQGDFTAPETAAAVGAHLDEKADIVISDMSPNLSGIAVADQARAAELARAAADFARQYLAADGRFVAKIFQGAECAELRRMLASAFAESRFLHLSATRQSSREIYCVANRPKKA
ncbi:MAG: RlmE family RNA methyltransferase [Gammaproteobacteria bacterium]